MQRRNKVFGGRACRIVSLVALAYAVVVAALGSAPFWRYLTPGRALIVAAPGCGLSGALLASVRASETVAERVIPVVMASNYDRGSESPVAAESCRRIAQDLRSNGPWLAWVPQRFLCASVRRYVRRLYQSEFLLLGGHVMVLDGRALGTWDYAAALHRLGLRWTRGPGGDYRLAPWPAGEPVPPVRRPSLRELGLQPQRTAEGGPAGDR